MALMEKARLAATVYSLLMFSFVFNVVQIIARYVLVLAIETPVDTLCNPLCFYRKFSHIQPTRRQQSSVVAVVPNFFRCSLTHALVKYTQIYY